ncbi:hypothetical protein ICW40_06060 [Actinotalea ferrariae]|uniref:hypothetical protein n=1 Tax=Actinotalea ferrariae TaxID=1386098 RepID=UPI001C8B4FCE|nr:hypothetical protein [Actinotalea ferrariae]MBX9244369.1 hypothetical protein [Actinotalea ferrariae]
MSTATAPAQAARTWRSPASWPWWVQVLAVQAAARLVSAGVLMAVAERQAANLWTPASPSYLEYTGLMWDASWYRTIAEDGYPDVLPLGPDGRVQQNAWAFFPLFPGLARVLMTVTGAPWATVAPLLALVLGTAALLLVHRTVALGLAAAVRAGVPPLPDAVARRVPLATVALVATGAASPVLQVGYTESLALLLLAAVLWCLLVRRYLLAVPVVLALGLTRAVALPVAVAVLAHAWQRHAEHRRAQLCHGGPVTAEDAGWQPGERVRVVALAVVAGLSGLLWPAVTGLVTGQADAYTLTQGAWRGRGAVVPLVPWVDVARWLLGPWGSVVLVGVALGLAALLLTRPLARLGAELRGWTAGYLLYLVAVLEPGTSLVRFGLLAFPVAAVTAQVCLRTRRPRTALAAAVLLGVVGQVAWVGLLWRLVPPSGWPP